MKRLFLLLPLVAFLLIGCDDAVTDSISENDRSAVAADDVIGKKNDNNGGDKGGRPGGGGGNDANPTYSNIKVENLGPTAVTGWYDPSVMNVPSVVASYDGGRDASEFFGCPDATLPCYRFTVTVDQADVGDAVAVRIHPFEEDARCADDVCPTDMSLGDDRRLLSVFDSYLGTPYITVDPDNPAGDYVFYWQGQLVRQVGLDFHGYFRFDRDPDDGGDDLLRPEPAFFDAGSGYLSGTSLTEIDACASSSDCLFNHAAPVADLSIGSQVISVSEPTQGRGRNKTSSTTITVFNTLNGASEMSETDSGSDVWVVYLIDNLTASGDRIRTVDGTASSSFTVSPQEGCLLIRPMQAQLYADNVSELNSYFSADLNGEFIFDVGSDGALSAAETGSTCALAF